MHVLIFVEGLRQKAVVRQQENPHILNVLTAILRFSRIIRYFLHQLLPSNRLDLRKSMAFIL